jgi:hypothetical protein
MRVRKAFAGLDPRLPLPGLLVPSHRDDRARLDAAQDRDQAPRAPALGRRARRGRLLALVAVVAGVVEAGSLGLGLDGPAQRRWGLLGIGLLVLQRHRPVRPEAEDAPGGAPEPLADAEAEPIEAVQDTQDQ